MSHKRSIIQNELYFTKNKVNIDHLTNSFIDKIQQELLGSLKRQAHGF